jgi:EF hand
MRTSIISSVVSGFIALSMAACSGASNEPVDQSAQTEHAGLTAPTTAPAAAGAPSSAAPVAANDGEHHMRGHGAPDPAMIVKRFDKNGDGVLQVSELPEHMQKFMAKADTNNDGVLSIDELKAGEAKMKAEHMAKVDTNHDGTISPEERKAAFEKFAQERFAKLDKNGDGALTKDEVGDKRWERLSVADADKNGSVTQAEIRQAVASGVLKFPHREFGGHGGRHGGGEQAPAPAADPSAPSAPAGI